MLVGDPVERCPTATGLSDPDVLAAAALLAGPGGPGALAGARGWDLPPRWTALRVATDGWREVALESARRARGEL